MKENLHPEAIPASTIEQVMNLIQQASDLLAPHMVTLSAKDRQDYFKLGDATLSFTEKSYDFVQQTPQWVPPMLKAEDFKIDLQDAVALRAVRKKIEILQSAVSDTEMVAGAEAVQFALMYYAASKVALTQKAPGAKEVVEELKKRFPQGGRRKAAKDDSAT